MGQGRMRRGGGYLLDNQQAGAGVRFAALSVTFDPVTFRHLDGLGIGPGWGCWEVGASGSVTAGDLDGYLASIAAGRLDLATAPMISASGRRPGPAGPR